MKSFLLLIFLTQCVVSHARSGKIYKWVDEEGNIHYSENKNTNKKSQEITPTELNTSEGQPPQKSKSSQAKVNKRKLKLYSIKDKNRQRSLYYKKQSCRREKKRMKKLEKSFTYRTKDSNSGGYIYYTANKEARVRKSNQKKRERQRKRVKKFCR